MDKRPIGTSGLQVTPLSFGASALGDMPDTYGYAVSEERALATIRAIFDGPANMIDTSRAYGFGRSEERIGQVIRERGGLPEGFVLSTKLDRDMETRRFDAARVRRSLEESLERLGLDRMEREDGNVALGQRIDIAQHEVGIAAAQRLPFVQIAADRPPQSPRHHPSPTPFLPTACRRASR